MSPIDIWTVESWDYDFKKAVLSWSWGTTVSIASFFFRLSDYLFTAARLVADKEGKPEVVYNRVDPWQCISPDTLCYLLFVKCTV